MSIYKHPKANMEYWVEGDGTPILLLHGGNIRAHSYIDIRRKLSEKYKIISVDLPGHGNSSSLKSIWSMQDYADYLDNFLDNFDEKKFNIIGHSFGGGIGIALSRLSEKINKTVLVNPLGIPIHETTHEISKKLFITESINAVLRYRMFKAYVRYGLDFLANVFLQRHNLKIMIELYKSAAQEDLANLPRNASQIFVFWGNDDKILSTEYGKQLEKDLKPKYFEFINGNHSWLLYDSDRFVKKVVEIIG